MNSISRDDFIAHLVLLGFEHSPSSKYRIKADEFFYRMRWKSLSPVMITVVVFQKKAHVFIKHRMYKTGVTEVIAARHAPQGPHDYVLRWLKDEFHDIIKEAESNGARRI